MNTALLLKQLNLLQQNLDALRRQLEDQPQTDADFIRSQVAAFYRVPVHALDCKCRRSDLVWPRHVAMFLCRDILGQSLVTVGQLFGGRDHSTALNAWKHVRNRMQTEPKVRVQVEGLVALILPHVHNTQVSGASTKPL